MPERIQQRRTMGWRMPLNARSVARPSRFGNFCPPPEPGEIDWCHARILIEESNA